MSTPWERAREAQELRAGVASTLDRLATGERWELRGFRSSQERAAYQAVVAEVAAARRIPVRLDGSGTSLTVVRSG